MNACPDRDWMAARPPKKRANDRRQEPHISWRDDGHGTAGNQQVRCHKKFTQLVKQGVGSPISRRQKSTVVVDEVEVAPRRQKTQHVLTTRRAGASATA